MPSWPKRSPVPGIPLATDGDTGTADGGTGDPLRAAIRSCGPRTALTSCTTAQIRQAAAGLGLNSTTPQARGHDALETRGARAYQEFVAPGQFTFTSRDNAARLGNVVKFNWDLVPAGGSDAAGAGLEILMLDEEGRIKTGYQFIEG
jgi:hypothetical protein